MCFAFLDRELLFFSFLSSCMSRESPFSVLACCQAMGKRQSVLNIWLSDLVLLVVIAHLEKHSQRILEGNVLTGWLETHRKYIFQAYRCVVAEIRRACHNARCSEAYPNTSPASTGVSEDDSLAMPSLDEISSTQRSTPKFVLFYARQAFGKVLLQAVCRIQPEDSVLQPEFS